MGQGEGIYNIKAVSKMLGIQPGTLRAWERRYKIIAPPRSEAGHRLYTDEHIKVLRWLISKVNQGFTISQAAALLENPDDETGDENAAVKDKAEELGDRIFRALMSFNEMEANELLNQAFSLFTIDKTVMGILGPLLVRVGAQWEKGEITTAHEHFASSFLRTRIENLSYSFLHHSLLPKAVAVCGPGERHQLGLLIFTLFLRRKGFEVIYLGESLADQDIEVVIDTVKPKFLFLSCTMESNLSAAIDTIAGLTLKYASLSIGLGGAAADSLPAEKKKAISGHIVGSGKSEWEDWLKKQMD
ncbi:MerR family transcriptional regulator [Mesobacillus zeae]|uniref:MerR family transcriptional regulator n=1 Tax=Mesobacillus zeae TaxID=1917180 RepID=A0A398BHY7_9BACI|nr:MerR family transcriptional regulator [Mesobacillus zeae]RID87320.1 MerR family transcriptional regulator [Mesobacillus zeae]